MSGETLDSSPPVRRCAIYARKSNEHGLDQDFNSLEAQRELCSAYITSQKHRGWTQLAKVYVDAAQSGGTLDRPALQELLADAEAGGIDIVVIYKLDRLSRSLLDFVRLVAVFERNHVSFVCITQNFDTGDSLGRLIMNVLLTFAQFERELTGDRIRDKRRAMAAKGIWVGSRAPFGYDYIDKRLVPNAAEASIVRYMFQRYLELHSMNAVWRECSSRGIRSKDRISRDGEIVRGRPIHRATVRSILCNPVYKGEVTHLGKPHPGLHRPLLSRKLWKEVERLRMAISAERNPEAPLDLLPPAVFDCFGRRMAIVRKYRNGNCERHYYSYPTAWGRAHNVPRMRAEARELEKLVVASIASFLADREQVRTFLLTTGHHGRYLETVTTACDAASRRAAGALPEQQAAILSALVSRIELSRERMKIILRLSQLKRFLEWEGLDFFSAGKQLKACREPTYLIDVPATAVRLSRQFRLPIAARSPDSNARPDPKLLRLMKQVRHAQQLVDTERLEPVSSLARRMSRSTGHFMKLIRLNYLAPDIVTAILDGTQPPYLNRRTLLDANLPTDWPTQRKLFGFADQPPLQTCERY